jgi:flavin reductase (DIM6/NTAB) family NADH-FMN oxidoreductase RutF
MYPRNPPPTAPFTSQFFPQHLALLTCAENLMPIGYWTVIGKEPFRVLICMQVGNYTLNLLKKHKEAALHFMPWSERERVVKAGHISARDGAKAPKLGFELLPAEKLAVTKLVQGADVTLEMTLHMELMNLSREFALFAMNVVAVHGSLPPAEREPILYLSQEDFATLGERWRYTA